MEPRLTISIPTLDRPEHLQHAIDSCLAQTVPVRIIIADQGHKDETKRLVDRYADHPHVRHVLTGATCLWENWRAAAELCESEFFAWLQDDDIVSRIYASRALKAFDAFPAALHWQASCHCSVDRERAVKWGWNGPQVPTRMIDAGAEMFPGEICIASMFFLSWALSPGVAFRCGPEFSAAIEGMPSHCDLFSERLIVAAMGAQGPFVADSVTAGYWHHHDSNESAKQNANGPAVRDQFKLFCQGLDSIIDGTEGWDSFFFQWLLSRNPDEVVRWYTNFTWRDSRHGRQVRQVMRDSLKGRVQANDPEALRKWLETTGEDDSGGEELTPEQVMNRLNRKAPAPVAEAIDLVPIYV